MQRALEQGQVGGALDFPQGVPAAAVVGAAADQHQQREVGPRRLLGQRGGEPAAVLVAERLFGHQGRGGTSLDLGAQLVDIPAALRVEAGLAEHATDLGRIVPKGGQHQHAPFQRAGISNGRHGLRFGRRVKHRVAFFRCK